MAEPKIKNNSYWFENDGPYCTACWDDQDKKVRLHDIGDGWYQCPAGKKHPNALVYPEKDKPKGGLDFDDNY